MPKEATLKNNRKNTNQAVALFVLVQNTVLPHKCITCGFPFTGKELALDLGVSLDFEGALYLCFECAKAVGRAVGLIEEPSVAETPVAEELESQANSFLLTEEEENAIRQLSDFLIKHRTPVVTDDLSSVLTVESTDEKPNDTELQSTLDLTGSGTGKVEGPSEPSSKF